MKTAVNHTRSAEPNDGAPPFGQLVRRLREAAGYPTKAALARALGVTPETIWKLENESRTPQLSTVLRLVERGGLPLEAFISPALILAAAKRLRGAAKGGA